MNRPLLAILVLLIAPAALPAPKAGGKGSAAAPPPGPVPEIPDLPPPKPAPLLPPLPDLPEWRVIDARSDVDQPLPTAAPTPEATEPGPAGFSLAGSAAVSLPTADIDLSPSYALELAYGTGLGGRPGGVALGLRAGYALFAAKRTVMVAGRGLDPGAYQASHLIPISVFVRALGSVPALERYHLSPYLEAAAGLGLSVNQVHAFGMTDAATTASPEVAAAIGLDWRPAPAFGVMAFARLRSASVDLSGRASQAFLRSSLSSLESGATAAIHF